VPRNVQIQVRFDEPIQPTSLEAVTLTGNGLPVPITTTLSDGNRTLTLTPSGLLAATASYVVSVEGVRDIAGNIAPAVQATFVTATGVDFIRPSVTAFFPLDGAVDVPTSVSIEVTFNEPINPLSALMPGSIRLFAANTGEVVESSVSFTSDFRTVFLTPLSPLAGATRYTIDATFATTDRAGNPSALGLRSSFSTVNP